MIAFEIHIHKNGAWKVDSIFDDRELALHEARRAEASNRYAGIRVVEEVWDEATGKTNTRVIFRTSRADKEARARRAAAGPKPRRPAPRHGTGREPVRKSPKPPRATTEEKPLAAALLVLLVLAAAFAGLVALSRIPELAWTAPS